MFDFVLLSVDQRNPLQNLVSIRAMPAALGGVGELASAMGQATAVGLYICVIFDRRIVGVVLVRDDNSAKIRQAEAQPLFQCFVVASLGVMNKLAP